jgi:hypothetical protein
MPHGKEKPQETRLEACNLVEVATGSVKPASRWTSVCARVEIGHGSVPRCIHVTTISRRRRAELAVRKLRGVIVGGRGYRRFGTEQRKGAKVARQGRNSLSLGTIWTHGAKPSEI